MQAIGLYHLVGRIGLSRHPAATSKISRTSALKQKRRREMRRRFDKANKS